MAALTGALAFALSAVTLNSTVELSTLYRAASWPSVRGEVTATTAGGLPEPSRRLWRVPNKYLAIDYQFQVPTGQYSGQSRVLPNSELRQGGSAEVKYNPQNPAESLLLKSLDDRRDSATLTLAITLPSAIALLLLAMRLWRRGADSN